MFRSKSNRRSRTATPPRPCVAESLEGRRMFSATPLAGVTDYPPGPSRSGAAGIIAVLKHSSGQGQDNSIIAVLKAAAPGQAPASAARIIAV